MMSTAQLSFAPKRVKIQNGWIWEWSPKEESKSTHVGFSQNQKSVKLRTSTMCPVGSSSPSLPRLRVFPALRSPGKVPVLQSGGTLWGEGAAVCAEHMRHGLCCSIFPTKSLFWLGLVVFVGIHTTFLLDAGFELPIAFLLQFPWQMALFNLASPYALSVSFSLGS